MPFTHRQLRRKNASATAGAPLNGPGGLLATPGMGRLRKRLKAKKITGNLYRGDTGQFQAGGASSGNAPAPTTPRKGRKPAKTEQERTQERQAKQNERDVAKRTQQAENRAEVLRSLNIAPDGAEALAKLRSGEQPDADAIARGGFVEAGLVEQAADGSYRMTPSGRALLSAADSGDRGRAGDTISGGRDRVTTRRQRRRAAAERKQKPKPAKASGGGDKEKPRPKTRTPAEVARRMRRIDKRIARFLGRTRAAKSFTVYKSHDGAMRWIARTTTAYRDRDREILPIAALDQDSQRMTAARQFGPLRFWHIGRPDPLDAAQPWGPGLDVGECDFSTQIGTTRVESGTFKSATLAQRIAETAAEYELSPGFFHPPDQPGADGVFTTIRTFERSLVPTRYGRASNLFTGLTVKGVRMDPDEMERRFKAAIAQLQLPPEQAAALSAGLIQADKSAQQQGIAYKSAPATVVIGGVTYTAEQPAAPPPPDVVINGVTYKAAPPFVAEEKAPMPPAEMIEAGETEVEDGEAEGEYVGDMTPDAFKAMMIAILSPLFGDMKMSEMKAMFATKDDSRAQQVATLEATLKSVQDQLAALSGLQPNVTLPDEIAAALKSQGPAAPPSPNQPQLPADASPLTQLAARLAPQLYANTPNGAFNGWTPPVLPQS